jgi:hypothetical protein
MAPIDFLTKLKNTYFGHEGKLKARLAEADRIPLRPVSLKTSLRTLFSTLQQWPWSFRLVAPWLLCRNTCMSLWLII